MLPNDEEVLRGSDERFTVIATKRIGPGAKRDIGAEHAKGEFLVFLDDDSYPNVDFLEHADKYFVDDKIVALGGPGITPKEAVFWERVSGAVFLSKFSGGAPERYISTGDVREVYDWPSVNLMVRKSDFLKIGGFNTEYWPGEDTILCWDLIQRTGKVILYVPSMIVWHHRRPSLIAHLNQVGNYGLHRGFFAKKRMGFSMKLKYFVPSIFWLLLFLSILGVGVNLLSLWVMALILTGYLCALFLAYLDICRHENYLVGFFAILLTVGSHFIYGFKFIHGFFLQNLKSKLR